MGPKATAAATVMIWRGNITKQAGVNARKIATGAHQLVENAFTHSTARSAVTTSASGVNFHIAASAKASATAAATIWRRRLERRFGAVMLQWTHPVARCSPQSLETTMLKAIRDFFDNNLAVSDTRAGKRHTLELATATLLAEVMRLEGVSDAERGAVLAAVRERFTLSDDEARELVRLAEEEARAAHDYYQFTSLIRERYSQEDRQAIVELLWRVAYADATLSAHEMHVVRKIADLLYVPHSAYIAAKMKAKESASGP